MSRPSLNKVSQFDQLKQFSRVAADTADFESIRAVPGRISTEVDVRLSFDPEGSIDKGRHLIGLYEKKGVPRERLPRERRNARSALPCHTDAWGIHAKLPLRQYFLPPPRQNTLLAKP
jgi:hypothetical protein